MSKVIEIGPLYVEQGFLRDEAGASLLCLDSLQEYFTKIPEESNYYLMISKSKPSSTKNVIKALWNGIGIVTELAKYYVSTPSLDYTLDNLEVEQNRYYYVWLEQEYFL